MDKNEENNRDTVSDIVINHQIIRPGQHAVVKIDVGRLPSGTRILMNLFIWRSTEPGPALLVLGGIHGDEINGIEIVRRAIESKMLAAPLCGTVIAVPVVNVYGFINFSRDVPDGKDVNRSFPGNRTGSLASRVAHIISRSIIPYADIVVDFHTGGASRYNYPQVRYTPGSETCLVLARYFSPPFVLQKPAIRGSLRRVARDSGVPVLVYEGGEALRLDGLAIDTGLTGLDRMMAGVGLKDANPSLPEAPVPVLIEKSTWLRAARSGIFIWSRSSGALVEKGEPLGIITDPYGTKQIDVLAHRSGYLLGHNNAPVVSQGDALFNIGYEFKHMIQADPQESRRTSK